MPTGTLPASGKKIFEKVYNEAIANGKSKEYAAKVAWTAVKNAGWKKDGDKWVKGKSEIAQFSMSIVKASFEKENQIMRWRSVNSDTDPDLSQEAMSPELFADFVSRIESKSPIPKPFDEVVCEEDWCGGVPYLSISHYRSGPKAKNVPGDVESVYVDGKLLKSTGTLYTTPLGFAVFSALNRDLYKKKSDGSPEVPPEERIRISIGFLDLEHKHILDDGEEKVFARTDVGQVCELCNSDIGRKIYTKGQLVHLAMTRVPMNPRTLMEVDKSMDIKTKEDDAKSIVGDLADELEEESTVEKALVVKADGSTEEPEFDDNQVEDQMEDQCYDSFTDSYDQDCIDNLMMGHLPPKRGSMKAELNKADTVSKAVTKSESWGNEPSSSYLVVGDREHPTTWHLPVKKHGKYDRGLAGAAKAALTSNHRGKGYGGPDKAKALAKLKSIYRSQGWDWESKSIVEDSMGETKEVKTNEVSPSEVEQVEETPTPKAEVAVEEEVKQEKPNPLMESFSKVAAKVVELRDAGITGKEAEAELQPLLNQVGGEIEKSLSPAGDGNMAAVMLEVMKTLKQTNEINAQLARQLAVSQASSGQPEEKSVKIPKPRSLKIEKSAPNKQADTKKLSQIEKIALKSTGFKVE